MFFALKNSIYLFKRENSIYFLEKKIAFSEASDFSAFSLASYVAYNVH